MGSTGYHRVDGYPKPREAAVMELIGGDGKSLVGSNGYEIVESSGPKGGVFYAALKLGEGQGDRAGMVVGAVCLVTTYKDEVVVKAMSEEMGPYEAHAPAKVLDALSPVEELWPDGNEYAEGWRAKCRANLAKAEEAKRVKAGATVKFDKEVSFTDGVSDDTFRFVSHSTFFRSDGVKVRISGWRTMDFATAA